MDKFMSSCFIYIVDRNIIRARMKIFESQIERFGGHLIRQPSSDDRITHILVDDDLDETTIAKLISTRFSTFGETTKILRTKWLSGCIKQKKMIDTAPFEVSLPKLRNNGDHRPALGNRHASLEPAPKKSVYDATTDEDDSDEGSPAGPSVSGCDDQSPTKRKKPVFACEKGIAGAAINYNKHITDKLRVLAEGYKSTNDKWRALSYEKAIQALARYHKPISSLEEVRNIRGIGQRLADKILEIEGSGELRKADEFTHDEKVRSMNLFTNIFGVGPTIANQWYSQGFRTLQDVKEKAKLTFQQKIGLKYYDEFQMRMDRSEAEEIVNIVGTAIKDLNPDLIYQACGSYRRACQTCGDVDILITHPDGYSQHGVLAPLVNKLTEIGFLTDDLVECDEDGNQRKYMGVCKLKGDEKKHRRIDIIAVPYQEYATSLIYFTGSVYFTRSIYGKAKSMGMRLNHHGLRGGVMRQGGETLNDGYPIPTPTEESVFEKLGIPYRKPEERDL